MPHAFTTCPPNRGKASFVGGTYYVLTSTNLALPLSQWLPVFTNVFGVSGSFTLTASSSAQFYILRVQ